MSGLRPTEMTIRRLLLRELEKRGVKVNPEISFMTPVGRIMPDAVLQNGGEAKLNIEKFIDMVCANYLEEVIMVSKVLRKMEVLRGFIQIPAKSKFELIGNTPLPCLTTLNSNPARLDKYDRLWSPYLKDNFRLV